MYFLRQRLTVIFLAALIIVTIFIPQKSFSSPPFDPGTSFASALNSMFARGIGGLESNIASSLILNPSDLSYEDGKLFANIKGKKFSITVNPKILHEAINVVQRTKKRSFQVSQDELAGYNGILYTDNVLRNTEIRKLFLRADSEFALMVWGNEELLTKTPQSKRPNYLVSQLIQDNKSSYSSLLKNWALPPLSWPQISLTFNPNSDQAIGLVDLEYKPQVTFLSPYGYPVQAKAEDQKLGEIPYQELIQDVKARPDEYREVLPLVNEAASITATMGVVAAACQEPESCKHLQHQSWMFSIQPKHLINAWKQQENNNFSRPRDFLGIMSKIESMKLLKYQWLERSLETFESEKKPWDASYNAVLQGIQNKSVAEKIEQSRQSFMRSKTQYKGNITRWKEQEEDRLKGEIGQYALSVGNKAQKLAAEHFKDYQTVPKESPILQASLAVVDAWNGDWNAVEEDLKNTTQDSSHLLVYGSEVTNLGHAVASIMKNNDHQEIKTKGRWIEFRMNYLQDKALRESYNLASKYLKSCEQNKLKQSEECSLNKLLNWEAYTMRAGLYEEDVKGKDIPWLYGQFAYYVGVKLLENKKPEEAKDRLRFLSSYGKIANSWHGWKLRRLENDLREKLGGTLS